MENCIYVLFVFVFVSGRVSEIEEMIFFANISVHVIIHISRKKHVYLFVIFKFDNYVATVRNSFVLFVLLPQMC